MKIPVELLRNISSFFEEWRILDMLAFSKTKTKTKTKTIPYRYRFVSLEKIKNIQKKNHWTTNTILTIHIKNSKFKCYHFYVSSKNGFFKLEKWDFDWMDILWYENLPELFK
jgi:hypothetical protein